MKINRTAKTKYVISVKLYGNKSRAQVPLVPVEPGQQTDPGNKINLGSIQTSQERPEKIYDNYNAFIIFLFSFSKKSSQDEIIPARDGQDPAILIFDLFLFDPGGT